MKLWGGRFTGSTSKTTDDFNSSIRFDMRMYEEDIEGSIAHATMLGKQGIITLEDSLLICKTLRQIREDIEKGLIEFRTDAEDIHMNIESLLISRIGDVGKRLHTGRSRNDQVCLDLRMYLKKEITHVKGLLLNLMTCLVNISKNHILTIMPGYTHLQKAQPVTFAHHLMAYFQMFLRDIQRLDDCFTRTDVMPLGSGALAGTTYPLDRTFVAAQLGFSSITENSLDAVSDRDFAIELAFDLSVIMMHLSRFSEEFILWSSNEFGFIEPDDAYSTGSSIMPQKKNPDVAELVRGKCGRVYGDLTALLTVMKSLPLAYNKDMQEDKEAIFDAVDTVKMCLPIFTDMLNTMSINTERMYESAQTGFTNATDMADYLVKKGLPFRDAHEVIGKMVLKCVKENIPLDSLPLNKLKDFSPLIEEDVYEAISPETCVNQRSLPGGPGEKSLISMISAAENFITNT